MRMMPRRKTIIRLSLILLIVKSSSCTWTPNNPEKEELCQTKECTERGQEYKNNMDPSANPCQDFFAFTCGNWRNVHPDPKYAPDWNIMDQMNLNFRHIMRQVLESYKYQQSDNILFKKAKEVYDACVKIPEYPRQDANVLAEEIKKIGHLPSTRIWEIHLRYLKLTGESAFFRYKIMANIPADHIPTVMLMAPPSAYGAIFHEAWKPQEKKAYLNFLFYIMKSVKPAEPDIQLKEKIAKVFDFRKRLDMLIKRSLKRKPDSFMPVTEQDLDLWFLNTIRGMTKIQDVHWPGIVEVLLEYLPSRTRQTHKVVSMRLRDYFLDLLDMFKTTTEEILVNHMEIFFVERHLKLDEKAYQLLEETSIEPHGLLRYIRLKYKERWRTCIDDHNMSLSLEKLLYAKWFPTEYTETVKELITKLIEAMETQMTNSKWMDEATREKTMTKLKDLEQWIGYPPWITGNEVAREQLRSSGKEILTPNAALYFKASVLYVHAPLLLPPIFSPTIPAVYNYAGIGVTLGHELYHIMDECGSFMDRNWKMNWWAAKTQARCLRRMETFIETFNEITDKEFKYRFHTEVKSDTRITLEENLPDVMGLKVVYNVYEEAASKNKSVCKTLPYFDDYNCDQMFYIAYANTFCGYYTKKAALEKLETTDHSIDSIRVNGPVAQMKSFGTAFNCPEGSPMNPEDKLDITEIAATQGKREQLRHRRNNQQGIKEFLE